MVANQDIRRFSPIVVGGLSGSGTRVPVMYLTALGIEMNQGDSPHWDCGPISKRIWEWVRSVPDDDTFKRELTECFSEMHTEGVWGWKNPPNILMMKRFWQVMPQMKFIHIVRDGRDIKNGHMLKWLEKSTGKDPQNENWFLTYLKTWCDVNVMVSMRGEGMGRNYLMLRIEDIVPKSGDVLKRLADFAGVNLEIKNRDVWEGIKKSQKLGECKFGLTVPDRLNVCLGKFGYS